MSISVIVNAAATGKSEDACVADVEVHANSPGDVSAYRVAQASRVTSAETQLTGQKC